MLLFFLDIDANGLYLSPFKTSSAKWRGLVQKITPLASGENLGLNLTPVFKSLRSRLSKNPVIDDNPVDACEEIANYDLVYEKESIQYEQSQVTPSKTRHELSEIIHTEYPMTHNRPATDTDFELDTLSK